MKKLSTKNKTSAARTEWISPLTQGAGARYKQIVGQITEAVRMGNLMPGDRLPTQRELAGLLDVDLTTVTRAYNEIREQGLLQAATGRGSFIAYAPESHSHIDLSMNIPPGYELLLPKIAESISRLQHTTDVEALMTYHVGAGAPTERTAGALWLSPLLGQIDTERVVVCPGAQTAISALLLLLTQPGETIVADALTYPGFIAAARQLGRHVIAVEADNEGMDPGQLSSECRKHNARVIYLNPTIHNPTAMTMQPERRARIAQLAKDNNWIIIEDDPYGLLPAQSIAPIATWAPGQTYYISTLSKCLTPGMRIAWIVAPEGISCEPLVHALRTVTLVSNPLMVAVATDWIHSGVANDILLDLREKNRKRQEVAAAFLSCSVQAHPYGLHLWLSNLPSDPLSLVNAASKVGLGITASQAFSTSGNAPGAVRVSLGGARDINQLKQALARLNNLLKETHSGHLGVVV